MKVGEIIRRLNKKESIALLAKQLGITPYTLSKKLRLLGYEYDSEQKKRVFVGAGEEPYDWNILDISAANLPNNGKEELNYDQLIYEELQQIRILLEGKEYKSALAIIEGEKAKRTFAISLDVLERLDRAAKETGWQKSRIVETALQEWLQKL